MPPPAPSLASASWLRAPATQSVLATLAARGFEARVVGGAVRNALLGRPVADVDIATTATPEQVMTAARAAGFKTIATGLQHGTITVVTGGHAFEVTTLRTDVATDGRHATVVFTGDWTADASRRDLTLNALYCDADGTIFDPLGGLGDVLARRVRFVGDPGQRISEDYLRILRFFRFTAEYADGPPDAAGLAAAVAARHGLKRLSAERIRAEFMRLLVAARALPVIDAMASHGLLTALLPVAPRLGVLARLAAIEQATAVAPDAALRLAALTVAVAEDAPRLGRHLRLSIGEREVLAGAAATTTGPGMNERAQRTALYRLGEDAFRRDVLLAWAGSSAAATDPAWHRLLALPRRWPVPVLPFAGRDLLARGVPAGPRIGRLLAAFEAWWIEADFPADRPLLEAALDRLLAGA